MSTTDPIIDRIKEIRADIVRQASVSVRNGRWVQEATYLDGIAEGLTIAITLLNIPTPEENTNND